MSCFMDLPVEVLEEIASHAVSPCKRWTTCSPTTLSSQTDLFLRLVHPFLTPIFSTALIKHSKIVINPRQNEVVQHLISYLQQHGAARYLTHLEVLAENFTKRTSALNTQIYQLVGLCDKLVALDLSLDGHFVQLSDFPVMKGLKKLLLQGESLYSHLGHLHRVTPNLVQLDVLAPGLSGPPPYTGPSYNHEGEAATLSTPTTVVANVAAATVVSAPLGLQASNAHMSMPETLSHLHIANLNTPAGQLLLHHLPFRPIHFSYSLLHNYDLSELALLMCRECFCTRASSFRMAKSRLVAENRLKDFKAALEAGILGRPIEIVWN